MRFTTMIALSLLLLGACESDEERCKKAQSAAQEAWTVYLNEVQTELQEAETALQRVAGPAAVARDSACNEAWQQWRQIPREGPNDERWIFTMTAIETMDERGINKCQLPIPEFVNHTDSLLPPEWNRTHGRSLKHS